MHQALGKSVVCKQSHCDLQSFDLLEETSLQDEEVYINGSFDNKEIGGQNLSRFTMSSLTKATLSIYSQRGFVLALPKLVKNATQASFSANLDILAK